ncbi:hypothetical protein [Streptomyces sp. CC208A]|uniref:hypothetical protein n=1 Tax=Streptomyces sp. CC208A TaxID=3044573 RepID=UPI0024A89B14|nr:hypothetical protein [Streptomyces sp. CC208A]
MPDTRCKTCGATTSADGSPTTLVALADGEPVYACAEHAAELAAPPGDLAVALAQLLDVYRRLYGGP